MCCKVSKIIFTLIFVLSAFAISKSINAQSSIAVYDSDPPSGSTISLGLVPVGNYSPARYVTVKSTGTATLKYTITNSNPDAFDIEPESGQILPGNQKLISIRCHPNKSGLLTGTMTVFHNASGSPARYKLTCYGGDNPGKIPEYTSNPSVGSSIDLGKILVGTTTPVKQLKVTNTGGATLNVTGFIITGTNPDDFNVTGTPLTLNPSIYGELSITCTPADTGTRTATLLVNHNALNSPASYTLTCIGEDVTGPIYVSDPPPGVMLDVGDTTIGQPIRKAIAVTNDGNAALIVTGAMISGTDADDFQVSPMTLTIEPNSEHQDLIVTCTPSAAGQRKATLTVTHNAPNSPAIYTLSCTGQAPIFNSNPPPGGTLDVGSADVGISVSESLNVSNSGNATLNLTGATISGANAGDFQVSPTTLTIAPGGETPPLKITCTPSAVGLRTATLTIIHNASGTPAVYTLICTGMTVRAPIYNSDPSAGGVLDIKTTSVGTSVSKSIEVGNGGNAPLNVTGATISGTNTEDFQVSPTTLTIAPGGNTQPLKITCTPSAEGQRTATLTVTHNANGSPATYTLNCIVEEVKAPIYKSFPPPGSTLNIGNTAVSMSISKKLLVKNDGNAILNVSGAAISGTDAGDFQVAPTMLVIGPGSGHLDLIVTCTPSAEGLRTATLTVTHNASINPAVYTLTCNENKPATLHTSSAVSKNITSIAAPDQMLTTVHTVSSITTRYVHLQTTPSNDTNIADGIITTGRAIPYSFDGNSLLATKQLPTTLGGVSITVTDSSRVQHSAGMYSVSPLEINWLMPAEVALGQGKMTFYRNGIEIGSENITISLTAPGIFTVNRTGSGAPVALDMRIKDDGKEILETIVYYDSASGQYLPTPIDLGDKTTYVFLLLCGTGFRHNPSDSGITATIGGQIAQIYFSGSVPTHPGLDQINLLIPRSLIGKGEVPVNIAFGGINANMVTVNIK